MSDANTCFSVREHTPTAFGNILAVRSFVILTTVQTGMRTYTYRNSHNNHHFNINRSKTEHLCDKCWQCVWHKASKVLIFHHNHLPWSHNQTRWNRMQSNSRWCRGSLAEEYPQLEHTSSLQMTQGNPSSISSSHFIQINKHLWSFFHWNFVWNYLPHEFITKTEFICKHASMTCRFYIFVQCQIRLLNSTHQHSFQLSM